MRLRNVIFYVKDIKKSKDFYKKLGFKIVRDFGKFISYDTGVEDLYFSIMESDSQEKSPGKQVCAFWADDIEAFYQKIDDLKIKIATELHEATFGKTFAIRDPDGNKIEFVEFSP